MFSVAPIVLSFFFVCLVLVVLCIILFLSVVSSFAIISLHGKERVSCFTLIAF